MENFPLFESGDVVAHKKSGSIGTVLCYAYGDRNDDDYDYDGYGYDYDDVYDYYGYDYDDVYDYYGYRYDYDYDEGEEWEWDGNEDEDGEEKEQLVRVLWLDDTEEEFQHVNDIILLDRAIGTGQRVKSASDPTGQSGVVQDVHVLVDLRAPDGSIVTDVSSRDLKRTIEFEVGDCVVLGSWVGTVYDVLLNVTVLTDGGYSCQVEEADELLLKPTLGSFSYYPGQRVRATTSSVLKKSWWQWEEATPSEGTVTHVTVGSLFIHWIGSSGYGPGSSTKPSKEQCPKNVKLLSCLEPEYWEVGFGCLPPPYVPRPSESEETLLQEKENFEKAYVVVNARTKVDVLWQDGTVEHGIDSKLLVSNLSEDDHELDVGEYVVEKEHDGDISKTHGVVQSVNEKERTACVRWLKPEDPSEFHMEETVSLYELETHPDHYYKYWHVVFRLSSVSVATSAAVSNDPKTEKHMIPSREASSDLSWVGFITGLKNGYIQVTWGDGTVSMVGPREICVAGRNFVVQDESITVDFGRIPARSFLSTSIDFVQRMADRIFWWRKNGDEGGLSDEYTTNITEEEESAPITSNVSQVFDTAKDPLDHHFLDKSCQINSGRRWLKKVQQDWEILQNNLPDGIYVRVYEDRMDLLRAAIVGPHGTPYQDGLFFFDFHLPPSYPDVPPLAHYRSGGWRINPNLYEEGKVCLSLLNTWIGKGNEVWDPKSSSILQVLVSLQGLVLNSKPYFNEAGYDKEVGTTKGEKNSLTYNENTFLLNCKTMMYLMRRPPKDFDEVIKEHFNRRGWYILKACDAYLSGSLIGSLSEDASASTNMDSDSDSNSNSVGFKLMMMKILPKLYSALSEVGADCEEFNHLVQGDN